MMISFQRSFHASLHYHILRQLDLGRDAASLWRPPSSGEEPAYWAAPLLQEYLTAPPALRIQLQVMPLYVRDINGLIDALRALPVEAGALLADLLLVEEPVYEAMWSAREAQERQRLHEVSEALTEPLQALRAALWARRQGTPPPLEVFDAPPLGRHGRALERGGLRRCAVSLAEPLKHVLCQIFHEETHAIADPETMARWQRRGNNATIERRDTRGGGPGYGLHSEIERHAIAVGAEVIQETLPEWMPAYQRWCEPFVSY